MTIALLYKCRWNIEVLFKQLKQNFELTYFYSDSPEGIKTQIWIALIANLIFTVIHKRIRECEQFLTLVSMASNNMGSYVCMVSLFKTRKLTVEERNLEIIQLDIFAITQGGVFEKSKKSP
ncbi:MAG: transposase [Cytophagaceae bacterium]